MSTTTDSPKQDHQTQPQFLAAERIDLNASYFQRHSVKKLGAQWDGYTWYIEQDTPLEPFYDFLPGQERLKIDLAKSEIEAQARGIQGYTVDRENFRESGQIYLQGIAETLIEQGYQTKAIEIRDYGIFQHLERGAEKITLHLSQDNDQTAIYRVSLSNRATLKNAYSPWQNAEITDKAVAIEKTAAYIAEKSPLLAVKRAQKNAKTTQTAAENTAQARHYIDVPYMERFEAKGLGPYSKHHKPRRKKHGKRSKSRRNAPSLPIHKHRQASCTPRRQQNKLPPFNKNQPSKHSGRRFTSAMTKSKCSTALWQKSPFILPYPMKTDTKPNP